MRHSRALEAPARAGWSSSPTDGPAGALAWLREWQIHINAGDIASGRQLFADDVVAFGSLTDMMIGKEDLIARQWSRMWPRLRDFAFDFDRLTVLGEAGDPAITIIAPWQSLGRKGGDGWYERRGRATLILKRTAAGYRCVHSHFSMEPGIPPVMD